MIMVVKVFEGMATPAPPGRSASDMPDVLREYIGMSQLAGPISRFERGSWTPQWNLQR